MWLSSGVGRRWAIVQCVKVGYTRRPGLLTGSSIALVLAVAHYIGHARAEVDGQHIAAELQGGHALHACCLGDAVALLAQVDDLHIIIGAVNDLGDPVLGVDAYGASRVVEDCFVHGWMAFGCRGIYCLVS